MLTHLKKKGEGYEAILKNQWKLENLTINQNVELINENLEPVKPFHRKDSSNFVLFFNWDQCKDCIDQELAYISSITDYYNVYIIISFDSMAEFLAYKSSFHEDLPLYYLPKDQELYKAISSDFGVHTFVFYKGKITSAHIASASYPELSLHYYNSLLNK